MQPNSFAAETFTVWAGSLAGTLFVALPLRHLMTYLERDFPDNLKCYYS